MLKYMSNSQELKINIFFKHKFYSLGQTNKLMKKRFPTVSEISVGNISHELRATDYTVSYKSTPCIIYDVQWRAICEVHFSISDKGVGYF